MARFSYTYPCVHSLGIIVGHGHRNTEGLFIPVQDFFSALTAFHAGTILD
jgi:hypothetical protein